MAANAKFFRQEVPPSNLLGNFGADHDIGRENYQMIPIGDHRTWSVNIKNGTVRVGSADSGIAAIAVDENGPSARALTFIGPGIFKFAIRSGGNGKSGFTHVVLEDESGNFLDDIHISVKNVRTANYNIVLLSDSATPPSMVFSPEQARSLLDKANEYYLNVTNTLLKRERIESLSIQRNLSDKNGILQLDENKKINESVIFQSVINAGLGGVDIVYVFTWDIQGASEFPIIGGLLDTGLALDGRTERASERNRKGPTMIYINSSVNDINSANNQVHTAIHETGHHFGLSHRSQPAFFVMHEGGKSAFAGGRMRQNDIDHVNASGT
jgi:Metallo-peptidase family M12B Reprolysin-like